MFKENLLTEVSNERQEWEDHFAECEENPYYWAAFGFNEERGYDSLEDFFDTDEDRAAFWAAFMYSEQNTQFWDCEIPKVEFKRRIVRRRDQTWEIYVPVDFRYTGSSSSNVTKVSMGESVASRSIAPARAKALFGTREISDFSVNIQDGCQLSCIYCWAAERALSSGQISSRSEWKDEQLKSFYLKKGPIPFKKYDGIVMYPTHHDITRKYINSHVKAVRGLLAAGNDLLICSKASLYCIEKIAKACADYQGRVTFMVTITTLDEAQSVFWEPNAPLPCERIAALKYLYQEGFNTSVLIEPLLQGPSSAKAIYDAVTPYVSDYIWIGTMNSVDTRVDVSTPENAKAVEAIKRYNSIDNLRFLYESMRNLPKIKFKSSITRIFERDSVK